MRQSWAFFLLVVTLLSGSALVAQGPGYCVNMNGTNEFIRVNHNNSLNVTSTWTIEFWLNPDVTPSGWDAIFSKGLNDRPASVWMYFNSIEVWYGNGTGSLIAYTDFSTISAGVWQHVAATRTAAGVVTIYINGVSEVSQAGTSVSPTNSERLNIGQRGDGSYYYDGNIDEVRYWNVARTQTEIRENMNKKLTGSESGLVGYWRLDGTTGNSASDDAGSNNGNLRNTPTRTLSAAPIGDDSDYLYTNSWAGQSLTLTSPEGDQMTVSNVAGSPDGIAIYRVDETPNASAGISGIGGNEHYYGIWKANGGTSYTATYGYGGNDGYESGVPDTDLRVYSRSHNVITSWSAVSYSLDQVSKTITATGLSTEFMLGSSSGGIALPIELLDFHASMTSNGVDVEWTTATEINNDFFLIERSSDLGNWEAIATVAGQGNSNVPVEYSLIDPTPNPGHNYYRLVQYDFDGKSETFPSVAVLNKSDDGELVDPSIFPNPSRGVLQVVAPNNGELKVYDLTGKLVLTQKVEAGGNVLDVSQLSKGVYSAQLSGSDTPYVTRLVVR